MAAAIERATRADIPALVGLMEEFYAESAYALDRGWAAASFAQLLGARDRGGAWIARDGDRPAGHAVLALKHSMEFGGLVGIIDDLFVRPAFRRRGIGKALVAALFDECRRVGVVAVEVESGTDNAAATALYGSFGLERNDEGRRRLAVRLT